jgi:hypothetical protein
MSFQHIPFIGDLKKFGNQINLARELALQCDYEKRAAHLKYVNGIRQIFSNRCDSVISQQESEYETLFFPFKIIPFYYC